MNLTTIAALCAGLLALPLFSTPARAADPPPFGLEVSAPPWPLAEAVPIAATPTPAPPTVVVMAAPPAASGIAERSAGWPAFGGAVILVAFGLATYAAKKWLEFAPLFSQVLQSVSDLRARADRQAQKTGGLQNQLTNVAIAAGVNPSAAPPNDLPPPPAGGSPIMAPLVLLCLLPAFLSGCATDTADPAKNARGAATNQALVEATKFLGKVAVNALLDYGQAEMTSNGKADLGQSLSAGLWGQVDAQSTAAAFGRIAKAYSANKLPMTASVVQDVAAGQLAAGKDPVKVANAIATVVSTAAGAPSAP